MQKNCYFVPGFWIDCSERRCVQTICPGPSLEWPSPTKRRAEGESENTTNKTHHVSIQGLRPNQNTTVFGSKYFELCFFYLGNFDAPILFLGLVCGGIVVPGTVIIHELPVPLSYTRLDEKGAIICHIRCLNLQGFTPPSSSKCELDILDTTIHTLISGNWPR